MKRIDLINRLDASPEPKSGDLLPCLLDALPSFNLKWQSVCQLKSLYLLAFFNLLIELV